MPLSSHALTTIRDTEIENVIAEISAPIFRAANLNPDHVQIILIQDENFNAFVAGGQQLFINTGTIDACSNVDMLAGIIAHETGHIMGGHIVQRGQQHEKLMGATLTSYVLGIAAAISGAPEIGTAIALGGQHFHQRSMLQFSRHQESSADQSGIQLMKKTGYNIQGLFDVMNILYHREMRIMGSYDPYMLTHPLSQDRLAHFRDSLKEQQPMAYPSHPELNDRYERARTKLQAFLLSFEHTQKWTDLTDTTKTKHALYAKAILAHRKHDPKDAITILNQLITTTKGDPYIYEMKGQTAFEHGMMSEALTAFGKALDKRPNAALLLLQIAMTEITLADDRQKSEYRKSAISHLTQAAQLDPTNPVIFRYLAIAYGGLGETGKANAYLAEEAYLLGDAPGVRMFADRAAQSLPPASPEMMRVNDMLLHLPKK